MPTPDQMKKAGGSKPAPDLTADQAAALGLDAGQTPVQAPAPRAPQGPVAPADPEISAKDAATLGLGETDVPAQPAEPKAAQNLTPFQAGALGLSAGDAAVTPEELEKTGHVKPGDPTDPQEVPPTVPEAPGPAKIVSPIQGVPPVGRAAPTVKDMIASLAGSGIRSAGPTPTDKKNPSIGEMLAGLGGGLGDFLQRWGLGLQGKGEAQTQGDIKRAQAFELQKQQATIAAQQKAAAIEQQYALDRMNIQNQLNMANLPAEKRAELQNQLAIVEAQHQARLNELGAEIGIYYQKAGMQPGAKPGMFWTK